MDENARSNPPDYTALTMQFKWLGHRNCLRRIQDTNIRQITSTQLKRLNAMNSISAYYHLALSTIDTNSTTNLSSVPSIVHPLVQKFSFLFGDPQGLTTT